MQGYSVSRDQVDFFKEYGYVKLDNVLTSDELESARSAIDQLIADTQNRRVPDDSDYGRIFMQLVNLWLSNDAIRAFTLNPKIGEIARQLQQCPRLRLWHDHALVKLPGDSRETAWHQDLPYWPMAEEGTSLSCWMALDDVDDVNGCMRFTPGSHKLGRLEPISLADPKDIFTLPGAENVSMESAVSVHLKAGSCTFHEGRTFHFASANKSDRPRRAMVVIFMEDGTTYNGKRHIVTDPLGLEVGKPLAGDMFPVVAEG